MPVEIKESDIWFTPREILDPLGHFDLDPCNSMPDQFPTASKHFGPDIDGLSQPWEGRVWLNPPFSNIPPWLKRMREHGNGIALVFSRTDSKWFSDAVKAAGGVFAFQGRTQFTRPTLKVSRCPFGCVLFPFGQSNRDAILRAGFKGVWLSAN